MKITLWFITSCMLGALLIVALSACGQVAKHQAGGASVSRLAGPVGNSPAQTLVQPENPEGESRQRLVRTVTRTYPDGVTETTSEAAESVIGGSQDLAGIIKEYIKGDAFGRIIIALGLAGVAWFIRRDWPVAAGILAVGAVVTAKYGEVWALVFGAVAAGLWLCWHLLKSQIVPTK